MLCSATVGGGGAGAPGGGAPPPGGGHPCGPCPGGAADQPWIQHKWCVVCNAPADEQHLQGKRHLKAVANNPLIEFDKWHPVPAEFVQWSADTDRAEQVATAIRNAMPLAVPPTAAASSHQQTFAAAAAAPQPGGGGGAPPPGGGATSTYDDSRVWAAFGHVATRIDNIESLIANHIRSAMSGNAPNPPPPPNVTTAAAAFSFMRVPPPPRPTRSRSPLRYRRVADRGDDRDADRGGDRAGGDRDRWEL